MIWMGIGIGVIIGGIVGVLVILYQFGKGMNW